ncbi:MAG: ribokinase [Planctomycetota bacterium]
MGRVVVLGSSNTDLILRASTLPNAGETILGSSFHQAAGGKGANQAVAAVRAGASVSFIAAVGDDDYGRAARERLAAERIEVDHVRVVAGEASGIALIFVDDQGRNLIGVAPGANASITPQYIEQLPESLFRQKDVFVTQLETPIDTVHAGLRRAHRAGMFTLFNPAPFDARVASPDWLRLIDVLVVNEHEATLLAQSIEGDHPSVTDASSAAQFLRTMQKQGSKNVIVTLGSQGYVALSSSSLEAVAGLPVSAVDTVAAGDTFVGVLACGLADGWTVSESAQIANVAAAIAVTRHGAQPSIPRRGEIESLAKSVRNSGT